MSARAAWGAVVMGTGIVSVALSLGHHPALSVALLWLAAVAWVGLATLVIVGLFGDRHRAPLRTPAAAELTAVAATAVLGSRLLVAGERVLALALLILALVIWLALTTAFLRHPQPDRKGGMFMFVVAPASLAVLAASIAATGYVTWLVWPAVAAWALGLTLYVWVLRHFDMRELISGRGDHWIAGGALAISALASSEISRGMGRWRGVAGAVSAFHTISVVVWIAAAIWLVVLAGCELVAPRLSYDSRRWSTVFPVGMYAVCSFYVARVAALPWLRTFAGIWTWVSVAVWLVVAGALLARCRPRRGEERLHEPSQEAVGAAAAVGQPPIGDSHLSYDAASD